MFEQYHPISGRTSHQRRLPPRHGRVALAVLAFGLYEAHATALPWRLFATPLLFTYSKSRLSLQYSLIYGGYVLGQCPRRRWLKNLQSPIHFMHLWH